MNDVVYEIKKEKIRKTLNDDLNNIMEINIEYPELHSAENNKSVAQINRFYSGISASFFKYCEKKFRKIKQSNDSGEKTKTAEIMKYFVPLKNENYLSVVYEITHYDGCFSETHRIAQTWNIKQGLILPVTFFLKSNGLNVRRIKKEVGDIIMQGIKESESDFSYTLKSIKRYAYRVDPENYFLCEKGIAFWFDKGTLAPDTEGFPAFVIPITNKKELSD